MTHIRLKPLPITTALMVASALTWLYLFKIEVLNMRQINDFGISPHSSGYRGFAAIGFILSTIASLFFLIKSSNRKSASTNRPKS